MLYMALLAWAFIAAYWDGGTVREQRVWWGFFLYWAINYSLVSGTPYQIHLNMVINLILAFMFYRHSVTWWGYGISIIFIVLTVLGSLALGNVLASEKGLGSIWVLSYWNLRSWMLFAALSLLVGSCYARKRATV